MKITDTPFLMGDNARGWQANIDWLIRSPDQAVKVIEGAYGMGYKFKTPMPYEDPGEGYEWVWDTTLDNGSGAWLKRRKNAL